MGHQHGPNYNPIKRTRAAVTQGAGQSRPSDGGPELRGL